MQCVVQEKLDGISLSLEYCGGILFRAVTRGDGSVGEDITSNVQHIPVIPKVIGDTDHLFVRGEALITSKDFKDHFAGKGFENPRNTTSGIMRGKSNDAELSHVTFVAYEYHGPKRGNELDTEDMVVKHLADLGFVVPFLSDVVDSPDGVYKIYLEYESAIRETLSWLTDGLVVKVNQIAQQNRLGVKNGRPDYAVALKPKPKACVTKVIGITWEQGLSGRFTPVAQVEPTALDGVTLKNVNLHNLDYLGEWCKKGFSLGATIMVVRSGDVIPYLVGVINPGPGYTQKSESVVGDGIGEAASGISS